MTSPEVLVFGSMNADLVFALDRLPAPGETVIGPDHAVYPGGKGANQAVAAARAGATVRMAGCLGRDGFGDLLAASLVDAGVAVEDVRRIDAPTGCAAIGVDRAGANQIMVSGGANLHARAADVADARLTPAVTVLLQMEVTPAENWDLARRARRNGARVVLNLAPAAPVPPDVLVGIDVLVVNETEAMAIARYVGDAPLGSLAAAAAISARAGIACVVTLGGDGAAAFAPGEAWRIGALPVRPVDTTAAGDCFVGWLAARLAAGDGLAVAMRWASVAAALACLAPGAQPSLPTRNAVAARVGELAPAEPI